MHQRVLGAASAAAIVTGLILVAPTASAAPPSNDDFADAFALTGATATATGTNVDATQEAGEPLVEYGSATVWWRWVAPSDSPVTVSLAGSDFDTTLGVYTGSRVGALTEIDSNDDSPTRGVWSSLTFTATAGITYYLQVSGYDDSDTGSIALALQPAHLDIVGTVTDEDHQPLSDICAFAYDPDSSVAYGGDVTNSDGRYEISDLAPGSYYLEFEDCGGQGYAAEYYDDAATEQDAQTITVDGSGTVTADAALTWVGAEPARPGAVSGVPGNGSVTLHWTAPADDGGHPITGYVVSYSTDGGDSWSDDIMTGSPATSFVVGGLVNGVSYRFAVAARNAIGTGSYALTATALTPVAPAGPAPVNLAAIASPTVRGKVRAGSRLTASVSVPGGVAVGYQWQLTPKKKGHKKPKAKVVGRSASLKVKKGWKGGSLKLVVTYSANGQSVAKTVAVGGRIK